MSILVTIEHEQNTQTILASQGETLLTLLQNNGFHLSADCGGQCFCGKCKVRVTGGGELLTGEDAFLNEAEIANGVRLACAVSIQNDLTVSLPARKQAKILTNGLRRQFELDAIIRKVVVHLPKPSLNDQRDDATRLLEAIGKPTLAMPLQLLYRLPSTLREQDFVVTVTVDTQTVIAVEAGDTSDVGYGVAVDIGTTTVVCYLMDLKSGEFVDTASQVNAQAVFGADVISRIRHTMEQDDGLETLKSRITSQIFELTQAMLVKNNINPQHLYGMLFAGNSTMLHLLCGFEVKHIAAAPFIATQMQAVTVLAQEIGIKFNAHMRAYILPHMSSYVGADITAAILASGLYEQDDLSLLIDIGTNGEMVLGNKDKLLCCSTAAGPAFEGANIACGMGGVAGAINSVRYVDGQIAVTTIDAKPPIGICGSGIIDAVAAMLQMGVVDETGRLLDVDEVDESLATYLYETDEGNAFQLTENVSITAKDIREVQLAKAAIAAGIEVLMEQMGVAVKDIDHVYLAGGFGSFLNQESAAAIGLLPQELIEKTLVIGNGAGMGAVMAMLSKTHQEMATAICRNAKCIELSGMPSFQDYYIDKMMFE
ncbi:MAG: DUF4445 domain-containing protein [Hyphomonadaceae bacterium]|nr:DUF4445 domain-containing protein [Clostridia bacterium]